MTIKEALKHKGHPFWIPGCSRDDIPAFLKERGCKKGVEVGVSHGENIVKYAKEGFEIYGVDPWDANTDEDKFRKVISLDGKYGGSVEGIHKLAVERTQGYKNCKLIQATSLQAADLFPKRSLDFVYIDGNHSFGYVALDLMKWVHKVKKGGIIAGHDYYSHYPTSRRRYRQVGNIVDAFAKTYEFETFYVLGSKDKQHEGEDEHLSYLMIKHW